MSRQNFDQLQEIASDDLNKISARSQKFLLDTIIQNLMGNPSDGFFQQAFRVSRVSANEVSIQNGLGFQNVSGGDESEPVRRPVVLTANSSQLIPTADPTQNRIDIVSVRSSLIDGVSATRRFKDAFSDNIENQNTVVSKEWSSEFIITSGDPAAIPVAPATPAGYVKICEILVEAANGIVAASNITDTRSLLPIAGTVGATGSVEYDAVVGDTSQLGFSHETLKAALDDSLVSAGSKILVTRDESIGTIPEVTKDNIEIVFKPSVSFTDDGAGIGLRINADGVKIKGGRFADFTASAIDIVATKQYNQIKGQRFSNCATEISGLTGKNLTSGTIKE